jgi:hypothetical protein
MVLAEMPEGSGLKESFVLAAQLILLVNSLAVTVIQNVSRATPKRKLFKQLMKKNISCAYISIVAMTGI